MNKEQKEKIWVFIALFSAFVAWIGSTPFCSGLFLDFFPELNDYKKWIQLLFILFGLFIIVIFLFGFIYWKSKKKHSDKISRDEDIKKGYRQYKWIVWKQNIFKNYPLSIVKIEFVPLFVCKVIKCFISKKSKPYDLDYYLFGPVTEKEKYNYEKVIIKFFEKIIRLHIWGEIDKRYEVKFGRDFQNIEIKWTKKGESFYSEPKNGSYKKIFSERDLKHIKIFTWIFPFGLYWNLRRIIKSFFHKGS